MENKRPSPSTSKPEIIFWGTPEFAVMILDKMEKCGFRPKAIITTPDKAKGRKMLITPTPAKIWATERDISVYQPASLKDFNITEKYDLFVVAAYGKIIPKRILDSSRLGTLNVHPSILPKWRGPSPIQSSLLSGDKEAGVSIMLLDEEMDHGPVLKTEKIDLENWNPNYLELEKKLAEIGGDLLCDLIHPWTDGKIVPTQQDHSKATYCKKIEKADGFIEPGIIISTDKNIAKSLEAERKVRALNPDPGTFTILKIKEKEVRIKITKAKIVNNEFVPEKIIPEGRKEMFWIDFLKGNQITP